MAGRPKDSCRIVCGVTGSLVGERRDAGKPVLQAKPARHSRGHLSIRPLSKHPPLDDRGIAALNKEAQALVWHRQQFFKGALQPGSV
jgi:hypothetical protein